MRLLILILGLTSYVFCKTNTKSLTESMGQEVIELAAPIKDVPPDLDEEPSAEVDDFSVTSTSLQPATARDGRRATAIDTRRKMKDIDKIEGVKPEEDEARIEKELAELYKDPDYKADSAEVTKQEVVTASSTNDTDKPIARLRTEFKFQPDLNNPTEIEKFRTSVDEISCDTKKLIVITERPNSGHTQAIYKTILCGFFLLI